MTDDTKDTARDPERNALGPLRGGIRAAAKKAVRKVAKKTGRKKAATKATTKATTATAKASTRGTRSAKRGEKPASAGAGAPSSRAAASKTSAAKTRAASARTVTAASGTARRSEAAPAPEPGSSIESPRPPAPIHPGAALDSMQEHVGGLGSLLALWGPLIIVGFLVLVFRGGDEGEATVAAVADVPAGAAGDEAGGAAREPQHVGAVDAAAGGNPPAPVPGSFRGAPGATETFDGGFAMRTSMAGTPVFAGHEPGTGMPGTVSRMLYPSPPGPYRDPRYGALPGGESWSAGSGGEWMWSADGRTGPMQEGVGNTSVQWVRCAPPYYWCPAPSSPAWR